MFNAALNYVVSPRSKVFQNEWAVRDTIFGSLQQVLHLQLFKEQESLDGYCDLELLTSRTHMSLNSRERIPVAKKERNRAAQSSPSQKP